MLQMSKLTLFELCNYGMFSFERLRSGQREGDLSVHLSDLISLMILNRNLHQADENGHSVHCTLAEKWGMLNVE